MVTADIEAARRGDHDAFRRLWEPFQRELHAHCYRMLGSAHDADDALQDTSLRAWKGIARFQARSSFRSWLYSIATNTCLTHLGRRPKRTLPADRGPATPPLDGPGEPVVEAIWLEPYPDGDLPSGLAGPEARYEQREAVELAFVAALQHVPATQRAALILCEVLGFSAKEAAELLDTSVASINSALQRARSSLAERVPERSQQANARALGDARLAELVAAYVDAWERQDVDEVVAMLTEDATFAMPPLGSWFGPRPEIATFLAAFPLSGDWRWRSVTTTANGQPAIGFYAWDPATDAFLPFALNVLTFDGEQVRDVCAFVARAITAQERAAYHRWVDEPADGERLEGTFGRFGLPARLAD